MRKFPLVVSYYTQDTLYQLEVQNLIASCEKWGLEHQVEPITSFGSWEKNCCFKPLFLLKKLQQIRQPLFWVDADAVFERKPEWLDVFDKDLAVRINEAWEGDSKVNSGSIYVNATEGAVKLLKLWGQECIDALSNPQRTQEVWDQITLRDVIVRGGYWEQIGALPLAYCHIAGHPHDTQVTAFPIISHYQASRRLKKTINFA